MHNALTYHWVYSLFIVYVLNFFSFYCRPNKPQDLLFQMSQQNLNPTQSIGTNKNSPAPKDLTSTLIDSNINQMSWTNQMKPTNSSLSQSKSMGFDNKSVNYKGRIMGLENKPVTPQTKPLSLQSSANNWNDLWMKNEETQPQVKQLSLSDINDLLS